VTVLVYLVVQIARVVVWAILHDQEVRSSKTTLVGKKIGNTDVPRKAAISPAKKEQKPKGEKGKGKGSKK
jgi:hypothetical protein